MAHVVLLAQEGACKRVVLYAVVTGSCLHAMGCCLMHVHKSVGITWACKLLGHRCEGSQTMCVQTLPQAVWTASGGQVRRCLQLCAVGHAPAT